MRNLHQTLPLHGVRVLDAGHMLAGPFAAALLGDFGAEVIKVEHPRTGDGLRHLEPKKDGVSLWWKVDARNKRCVTLDLSKPEGARVFCDLVRVCDVVIENFRPGTLERWGLGEDVLFSCNPRLVLVRISGFGQTGPYRDRPAFGRVAEAMGGLANLIGEPDGPPMVPGYPIGDAVAGLFGAWAVLVALYHRDVHGGPGQTIDLALYEGILRLLEFDPLQFQQLGTVHRRTGNRTTYVAPSCVYRTRDGKYVAMAASTETVWRRLCQAMEREDLLEDPRFQTNSARVQHADEINAVVAEWVAHRRWEEVEARFRAHGVAYAPVYDAADWFQDPQVASRGILQRVPDPELGEAVVCGVVPRFSHTPGRIQHLGPRLGEHNREIYGQLLGYSEERLRALEEAGVI